MLVVEMNADRDVRAEFELAVELWRGDVRRSCLREQVRLTHGGSRSAAYRLRWSERPDASSRITCRVLLNDRVALEQCVLVGRPQVEAHGRTESPPLGPRRSPRRSSVRHCFAASWRTNSLKPHRQFEIPIREQKSRAIGQ